MRKLDLSGQQFGRLTVMRYAGESKTHKSLWECQCECGKVVTVVGSHLTAGNTRSCGCLHKEQVALMNHLHGLSNHPLHSVWEGMKQRCYQKSHVRYACYGGRGISVCGEWLNDFKAFYDWAISSGYERGLTIDRIDCDGDYHPDNCRWITIREQQRNKHNPGYLEDK